MEVHLIAQLCLWNTQAPLLNFSVLQYFAKVVEMNFDEFHSLLLGFFERNFAKSRAKSFTVKRCFEQHFEENRMILRKHKQNIASSKICTATNK